MSNKPTIFILLAAHNREHLIGATLESIRAQTYSNWECIIVDDHSSDNTTEVLEKYLEEDKRFSLFPKNDEYRSGLPGSRNYALDIAAARKPDYIQFFDDDDLMHPQKLEIQLKDLLENPDHKFSLCGRSNFETETEIYYEEIQKISWPKNLTAGEAFLNGYLRFGVQATLLKYEFIKDLRFDEDLEYAEDWVYFAKLFFRNDPAFSIINKVLFYRRKHQMSMTEGGLMETNKRGAEIIAALKIFDDLKSNELHTKRSIYYFSRRFLLYQFTSAKIAEISEILKIDKQFTRFDLIRFRIALKVHTMLKKVILRILHFN